MKWSLRDWVYIAIFGALWGVVEIGLGSYLHLLFPPLTNTFLSGLVLAFLGVAVALVGHSFVPRAGAVAMIGVVTALLKLLSPGGVKLGPLVAILAEAALMEAGLWAAGAQRRPSYVLAGGLAIAWNAVHPFIMQPLLFGSSVANVYAKLVRDGAALLGLSMSQGLLILLILLAIRFAVGGAAGWLAFDLGRSARKRLGR